MSSSKKIDLWQVFNCLRPPPLLGFCFGWFSNFVGSEPGQIQSVKTPAEYGLQQDSTSPTPSQPHIVCLYCEGGGVWRVEPERRLEGQQFTKLGRKYQHDWLYTRNWLSPVYKLWWTPAAKSLYRSIFQMTTFCIVFNESYLYTQ
jgi:hypothetical protein